MKSIAILLGFLMFQTGQNGFPQDMWPGSPSDDLQLATTTNTTNREMPRAQNLTNFIHYVESNLKSGKKLQSGSFVVLRVKVSECGDYLTHEVQSSNCKLLKHAGEESIRSLKFSPAIRNGVPVEAWIAVPIYLDC